MAGGLKGWDLFQLSDCVYLLDRDVSGSKVQTASDNLLTRRISARDRSARDKAYVALSRLEEQGVARSVEQRRLKLFQDVGYHLYEFHVGTTVWRMFAYKDPGNAFVIVIDIFEAHKGKANNVAMKKAKSSATKRSFGAAEKLAAGLRR